MIQSNRNTKLYKWTIHRNGSAKVNGGKSQWGEMMRLALDMANSPPDGLVISHFASFLHGVVLV